MADLKLKILGEYIGSAVSPTVTVEEIDGGHRVTIVSDSPDGLVTQAFDVMDGEPPTVDVTETDDGYTITFTDEDGGTTSYDVPDYRQDEALRVTAENARVSAEAARAAADESRSDAESARTAAEGLRDAAESERATAEESRDSAETERGTAETARVAAEALRASAEVERATAETARADAESARTAAEGLRDAAESERATAEEGRATVSRSTVTSATATVDSATGTPTVTVTLGEPAEGGRSAAFAFSGIKGETGDPAAAGSIGTTELADGCITDAKLSDGLTVLQDVEALKTNRPSRLTDAAQGTTLTAEGTYPAPPIKLVVDGNSAQDGTPTPDAPVPVVSVDELTLHVSPLSLVDGIELEQGGITSGVTPNTSANRVRTAWDSPIRVKADEAYTMTGTCSAGTFQWATFWYRSDMTYITYHGWFASGAVDTAPKDAAYARLLMRASSDGAVVPSNFTDLWFTVNYGSPESTPIDLQGHELRRLPSGVHDELTINADGRVTLTQRVGVMRMADASWSRNTSYAYAYFHFKDSRIHVTESNSIRCDAYPSAGSLAYSNYRSHDYDGKVALINNATSTLKIAVQDTDYTTVAAFKAALGDANLYFMLENPATYDLGTVALKLPYNGATVWATGGSADPRSLLMTYERDLDIAIGALEDNVDAVPELASEVEHLSEIAHTSYEPIDVQWGIGNFTTTNGADIRGALDGNTSRRSSQVLMYPWPIVIKSDLTYRLRATAADSSYAITGTSDFNSGTFRTIPANRPYRITIRNQSDTDISSLTDEEMAEHVQAYALFPNGHAPVYWCAMGDSITQGWYSTQGASSATNDTDPSKTYAGKVASINGWRLTNLGRGSTGWLDPVTAGDYTTAGFYVARHTDFSAYDLVTLAYGINDWKANRAVGSYEDAPVDGETPTTVMQAMRATIEAIMASNPECKIIVITPLNCVGYSYAYGNKSTNYGLGYAFSNSGTLESFVRKMIEVCDYYGIQYVDQTHYSCINRENLRTMLPDGVHPSERAHTLIAQELARKLTL